MSLAQNLIASLQEVESSFQPDELAYLALTQKVEHAVRDKLAFKLHQSLSAVSPELMVCREWLRADLAVVQHDRPLLILEAKAVYTFDICKSGAQHPFPELVAADLEKAARWASSAPPESPLETFALVIATHPHTAPSPQYRQAVKYFGGVVKYAVESNTYEAACKTMDQKMNHIERIHSCQVKAGRAFGVDVSVFLWLYKPKSAASP
ncbi:MAG: hypothetical protein EON54_01815 [Alcaligenaceae bacterium]|nr:MAG: hypothetical protein EON54_01815 [Alcaligenaceae bacterium]